MSYKIQVRDNIWRHHADQLLDLKSPLLAESDATVPDLENVTIGTRPPEVPLLTTPAKSTSQSVESASQS